MECIPCSDDLYYVCDIIDIVFVPIDLRAEHLVGPCTTTPAISATFNTSSLQSLSVQSEDEISFGRLCNYHSLYGLRQ